MYLLKVKGGSRIPDYLQIRDNNFTLVAYFSAGNIENAMQKFSMQGYESAFKEIVPNLKFGELKYIEKTDF